MAMSMEEFISLYFRQKHFNGMPAAVRAQFDEYIKKDDFRSNDMAKWKKELMHEEPANSNKFVQNELPDPTTPNLAGGQPNSHYMEDAEWDELYTALQSIFQAASAGRDSFIDKDDVIKFVNEYFGEGRLFSLPIISDNIKQAINAVINLISTDKEIESLLTGISRTDITNLKKIPTDAKLLNNPQMREVLYTVIRQLLREMYYGDSADVRQKLQNLNISDIKDELEKEITVQPADRIKLKNNFKQIFNTLHDKKSIYDVFRQYDSRHQISSLIDNAIKQTDYTGEINKDTFVPRKYSDKLNFIETVDNKITDTYNDVLKRFVKAHRDHIYIQPSAKTIIAALDKQKIKPTDGLAKVLEQADNISKSLQNKYPLNSGKYFEWFIQKMSTYKNGMPKAFNGALQDGKKMNHIVEQLIMEAIEEGKEDSINKAKTAMEILSVMQYGTFTSRTMDAINQTDFTLFSDKDLSWNKNEGVKMVTGALDKTIKFGVQVAGYATTAAVNTFRKRGIKFDHSGNLQKKVDDRNKKQQTWDDANKNQYLELMAFWDFLQTGNTKSMFHLSTKKLQEKMNTKSDVNGKKISLMEQNYEAWKAANGYAA